MHPIHGVAALVWRLFVSFMSAPIVVLRWVANLDAAQWSAIAAIGTLMVAIAAAIFAYVQIRDARRTREEQAAPYVIAQLEFSEATQRAVDFVVRNIGATPAFNVTLRVEPEMQRSQPVPGHEFMDSKPIAKGIKMLAPGQEIRMHFDIVPERQKRKLPNDFTVTINGFDSRRRPLQTATFDLDAYSNEAVLYTDIHNLHWIGTRVEGIEKSLKSIASSLDQESPKGKRFADPATLFTVMEPPENDRPQE